MTPVRIATRTIDLSTDAMTRPTPAMWDAMRRVRLGMASADRDESVDLLERTAAETLGKEAGLFVPTGRLGNLAALLAHAEPGDQVVLEERSHVLCCEDYAIAAIASLLPRPVLGKDGALDPNAVEREITRRHYRHVPKTGLVVLENTFDASGGTILTPLDTRMVCDVAHRHKVPVHIDGSRIFNAAVALGVDAKTLVEPADSVVFSLSKGLSAPFGAVLCGGGAFIERSRQRVRALGSGSMHKLGIAAAAGLVALSTMVDRLGEDNRRASLLARQLARIGGVAVDPARVQTNIVMVDVSSSGTSGDFFQAALARRGVLASLRSQDVLRLVTHRHIADVDVRRAVSAFRAVAKEAAHRTAPLETADLEALL